LDDKELVRGPVLIDKDLDYKGGVNLWRFGLRFTSRYQLLQPKNPRLVWFTHKRQEDQVRWRNLAVPDRPAERTPKRPGLVVFLPLTEPLMRDGAVPPLLAVLNDQLFAAHHAGDYIEPVIEVSRHPLVPKDEVNYWPEWGPDPI